MRLILFAVMYVACGALAQANAPQPPSVIGKAWLLIDVTGDKVLAEERADDRFEPASLTKLMTAYLVFAALKDRKLELAQTVPVSEKAWRAAGSRMFIEPNRPVTVDELVRGMIVQSGNDACIALAEAVAGSEEAFAQQMNREAARLGMKSTRFVNASGLPDAQHYSTARDLAALATALIRDFPEHYEQYYPMREYRYNSITQMNRNRLLWLDPTVDGVKTGYTEAAGYCLIASSRRGPRRMLSVLLGSTSEATRAQESQKLLNWGYLFFDSAKLYEKAQTVRAIEVYKGAAREVRAGLANDLYVTVPKGSADKLKVELHSQQPLSAPIAAGQRLGSLRVALDGKPVGEYPLIALEAVPAAGIFGRAWDTLRLWIK